MNNNIEINYENDNEYSVILNGNKVTPKLMFAVYEMGDIQYIRNNYANKWQSLGMLVTITEKIKQELTQLHQKKND